MTTRVTVRRSRVQKYSAKELGAALQNANSKFGQVFWSRFAHSLMKSIHESYEDRSYGNADDLGNRWKANSPRTMKFKKTKRVMVESGRLLASVAPGKLTRYTYQPPQDQFYKQTQGQLQIGTKVPYAARADKRRRIWPSRLDVWLSRAVEAGRDALFEEIRQS